MYILDGPISPIFQSSFAPFKVLAYIVFAPFLLIAVLGALACVLVDFATFRTREMLLGHPQPKGLWEF